MWYSKKKAPKKLFSYPPPDPKERVKGPVPGAVTITDEDLSLLEPNEFLNDNIIEFYMK